MVDESALYAFLKTPDAKHLGEHPDLPLRVGWLQVHLMIPSFGVSGPVGSHAHMDVLAWRPVHAAACSFACRLPFLASRGNDAPCLCKRFSCRSFQRPFAHVFVQHFDT